MPRRLALVALSVSLLLALGPMAELPLGAAPAIAKKKNRRQPPPFASDTAADPSPLDFWGEIHCANDGRHQFVTTGGDPHPTITGAAQGNNSFRRLSVHDGDDFWGERCELGEEGAKGPTTVYREGTRWITQMSVRLPTSFPLDGDSWQAIMQMKSTGTESSTGTPVLELDAYDGHWRLRQSIARRVAYDSRELWAAPATPGRWTRFSFDIRYSRKPWAGSISVSVDLNADGDFLDAGEQSGTMRTYTLKVELPWGARDGVKPGQSIPSHLRTGVYHDEGYDCPSPTGCYVDLDNVQVLRAP